MSKDQDFPETIDKYQITGILGQGAMGVVYKGYDERIDRQVAIKVLHPHLRQGDMGKDLMLRFNQEAKAAARCFHPNIVTIFDFGITDDIPFIVMEFVQGVELKAKLNSRSVIPISACIEITIQILNALSYAHNQGVVHRDIKPANIILLQCGQIKVSDFGVARIDTSDLTGTGFMVGTPNYMSPEGLRGAPVDLRSDLFSVGVLLFELITKKKLERGIPFLEALELLTEPSIHSPVLIDQLYPILEKALQSKADQRYQSADELIKELRTVESYNSDEAQSILKQVSEISSTNTDNDSEKSLSGTRNSTQWNPDSLKTIEKNLAHYIGPLARLIVSKIAKKSKTVDDLSQSLASQIPTEKERTEFLRELEKSGVRESALLNTSSPSRLSKSAISGLSTATGRTSSGLSQIKEISSEDIERATKQLAYYLGPLAGRIVKKMVKKARNLDNLYQQLAQQIPDEQERKAFLSKGLKR